MNSLVEIRLRRDAANRCVHFLGGFVDGAISDDNFLHWLEVLIYDLQGIEDMYRSTTESDTK